MMLDPATMKPLYLEAQTVSAQSVFPDERVCLSLQQHGSTVKDYEASGGIPGSVSVINEMKVPDGYIPEELSHQNLTGRQIIRQARLICEAPFFKAIANHPHYVQPDWFDSPRRLMKDTISLFNIARRAGNCFRRKKIHTMLGSPTEVEIAQQCFGAIWPPGIDLYSILREMYPAFHARITGQIPAYLAENMDSVLDECLERKDISGIGRFTVDHTGRFLGLYPVVGLPKRELTSQSLFVSQDQMGRKAMVSRILDDAKALLSGDAARPIIVIDYAGGVGNLSELLLRMIYGIEDSEIRSRLMERLHVVAVDLAEDQLAAGRNRFDQMNSTPELCGIRRNIIFIRGDVTKPLSEDQIRRIRTLFRIRPHETPVYLGMTSYTTGALDNIVDTSGMSCAEAMAREIYRQCSKIYAVDFSSPMWRIQGFLNDTGRWGQEYLRTIHGISDPGDEQRTLPKMLKKVLAFKYSLACDTVADLVRSMALGPGLSSHYMTVWPDSDGHNSGYSIREDGSIKMPGILAFATCLQSHGASVEYKSKVRLFATLDLGGYSGGNRAWALIPGWIADFVVAENPDLKV